MGIKMLTEATAVHSEVIRLKTISPLLMHGADPKGSAQARVSSFKGVIRYWWRALQTESRGLLSKESELFGGTGQDDKEGQASPLRLHVDRKTGVIRYALRPHRGSGGGTSQGIPQDTVFNLEWSVLNKDASKMDSYRTLLELTLALGGFGQRARRGYGSLQSVDVLWSAPEEFFSYVEERIYQLNGCRIGTPLGDADYPLFRNLWLGKQAPNVESVLRAVGQASSKVKAAANRGYELGSARPRQASPLHVGVRMIGASFYPVIVEVHPKQNPRSTYLEQRRHFLEELGVRDNV